MAEIETDKATMEFEAVDEGIVGKILIAEGTEGSRSTLPSPFWCEEGEDASALPVGCPAAVAEAAPAGGPRQLRPLLPEVKSPGRTGGRQVPRLAR